MRNALNLLNPNQKFVMYRIRFCSSSLWQGCVWCELITVVAQCYVGTSEASELKGAELVWVKAAQIVLKEQKEHHPATSTRNILHWRYQAYSHVW